MLVQYTLLAYFLILKYLGFHGCALMQHTMKALVVGGFEFESSNSHSSLLCWFKRCRGLTKISLYFPIYVLLHMQDGAACEELRALPQYTLLPHSLIA